MKHIPLLIIGISLFLFSCQKNYDSDLRGRWQLRTEIPSNGVTHSVDSIFYSFDNNVVSVQNVESSIYTRLVFGKFTQVSDSLLLDYIDWDIKNITELKKLGISSLSDHFLILELTSSTLHLKSKERELIFRKF